MATRVYPGQAAGSLRPDMWRVATLLPDGSVLLVSLGTLGFGPVRLARVSADLFQPDGGSVFRLRWMLEAEMPPRASRPGAATRGSVRRTLDRRSR